MAELNNYLKDLIKKNLANIQKGEFSSIYLQFDTTSSYDCYQISKFTNIMYDAGIDPLQYMSGVIPECFLFGDIFFPESFTKIPSNIKGIHEQAFSGCTFDRNFPVIIPTTCLEIRESAFAYSTINKIELNCINTCNIWIRAFNDAEIYEMWLNELPNNALFLYHADKIDYLYLPIDDSNKFNKWIAHVEDTAGEEFPKHKIKNIISSLTGEVFSEWS